MVTGAGQVVVVQLLPELAAAAVQLDDGTFVVTKHDGTGGLVTRNTVVSQLLYEMGDPKRYLDPDCTADFTSAKVEEIGKDRVRLSGIKGGPATPTYKVSLSYQNGFKTSGQLTIAGPDAVAKAKLCADIVWGRLALDEIGRAHV